MNRNRRRGARRLPVLGLAGLAAVLSLAGCGSRAPAKSHASAGTLVSAAVTLQRQGNANAARRLLHQALAKAPHNYFAHYDLGYLEQLAGQDSAALTQYRAALAAKPHYGPALYNEATIYAVKDLARAIALYREVLRAQPHLASAWFNLGLAELLTHKRELGLRALAIALHQSPALGRRLTKKELAAVGQFSQANPGASRDYRAAL